MINMKEHLQEKRNKILYQIWQEYKQEVTMEDLAEIFSIPLATAYRLIKKEYEKYKLGEK